MGHHDRRQVTPPPICPSRRPHTSQPRIVVVGGSLTGPVAALLLMRAGFDRVTVYEAVPAASTLGGGLISLEHSSLDVLDRLGIGQDEFVKHTTETILQITVRHRRRAETVKRVYPGRFTTWTLLHAALRSRLSAEVLRSGMRVTGLTERHGRPALRFADGQTECADLVAFADGRASAGRQLLDHGRALRYAGYVAHRGDGLAVEKAQVRRARAARSANRRVRPWIDLCDRPRTVWVW